MGIIDTVLAHQQRENELAVERNQQEKTWVQLFEKETIVFAKQIGQLDLEDPDDREKFYSLIDDAKQRFEDLRNSVAIEFLSPEAILQLDKFIEELANTNRAAGGTVLHLNKGTPGEEARRKRQLENERSKLLERREQQVESLSERISSIYDALPDDE